MYRVIDAINACEALDISFPIDDIDALRELEIEFAKAHEVSGVLGLASPLPHNLAPPPSLALLNSAATAPSRGVVRWGPSMG